MDEVVILSFYKLNPVDINSQEKRSLAQILIWGRIAIRFFSSKQTLLQRQQIENLVLHPKVCFRTDFLCQILWDLYFEVACPSQANEIIRFRGRRGNKRILLREIYFRIQWEVL